MSLHAKTCSITTVVRALAERDLLPDEEVPVVRLGRA